MSRNSADLFCAAKQIALRKYTFFSANSHATANSNDNPERLRYSRKMRLSGRKYSSYTRRWTQRQRVVLLSLIGINLIAYAAQLVIEASQPGFVWSYLTLSDSGVREAYAWQFLTAMFLHIGPWHLLGDMLILYLLGRDLESILGQRHFLYLYLAGSVAGELGHLFLMPSTSVVYAASGAVAAVVVAYAAILPELELTALMFFVVPIRLKAKHLGYATFILAITLLCLDREQTVSHSAYLGGAIAGWIYAHLLGFGHPSLLQRFLSQRRAEADRLEHMTADQIMSHEIDPLLEKIARAGLVSLSRKERRKLTRARQRILERTSDA
jgi:membrane associated rhomboid family serine protease